MSGRLIAIGDIHGCNNAFQSMLAKITPDRGDTIVGLGDYVDRGPDSRGVLDTLLRLKRKCRLVPLLGNHEQMMLEARGDSRALSTWLGFGGAEALGSYGPNAALKDVPPEHWAFLEKCADFYEVDHFAFIHATYCDSVPLEQADVYSLRWKPLEPEHPPGPHVSGRTIVVGHTPLRDGRILDLGYLIDIDTNCCRGGWLTALDVLGMVYWQSNESGQVREGRLRPQTGTP